MASPGSQTFPAIPRYLTRTPWPHLKETSGVVVNMASLNGQLSFKPLASLSHTANKAGIIGMTRQLALEGSEHHRFLER